MMDGFNLNGKIVIGIDHGYGNMKTRHFVFKSGVKAYDYMPPIAENVLEYNGKYYVIGENHKVFISNKEVDDDYYVLTLAAIAKELDMRGLSIADVIIAAGLPLNWLIAQRDAFKKYLQRNPEVDFKYLGKKYHIRICDVSIYPQGFAGIASDIKKYSGVHMLADIGNGTMNTLTIVNGKGINDKIYTDQLGVHQCVKKIINEVQAQCGKLPDETLIEEFLRVGATDLPENIMEVMKKVAEEYVVDIFNKLKEHEYDPDLVKLHIIGGGGCIIEHFGKYNPERVEIIHDICATAKGYENIYISMYERNIRKGA